MRPPPRTSTADRRSHAVRRAAAIGYLGGASIVATALITTATASTATATSGASRPAFRLTSHPPLPDLRNGAFVIDVHGRDHVVGSELSGGGTPDRRHNVTYLTRGPGSAQWTDERVAGHLVIGGDARFAMVRRDHGTAVVAVVEDCGHHTIYTVEAPAKATRLPVPTAALAGSDYNCHRARTSVRFAAAAAAPRGHVAFLFESPDESGVPLVSVGIPGERFPAPTPLPGPAGIGIDAGDIVRDPTTGSMFVVGNGPDGVYVWSHRRTGPWSEPERIAKSADYMATSIDANGKVVVGLVDKSHPAGRSDLAIATRNSRGAWSAPSTLPHGRHDFDLLVRIDRVRRTLHAAYDHVAVTPASHDGIRQMVRVNGEWSHQRSMTGHGYDATGELDLTSAGQAVVGYRYRPER